MGKDKPTKNGRQSSGRKTQQLNTEQRLPKGAYRKAPQSPK